MILKPIYCDSYDFSAGLCSMLLSNENVADVNKIQQFSAPLKSPHTFIGFLQELNGETGFFQQWPWLKFIDFGLKKDTSCMETGNSMSVD